MDLTEVKRFEEQQTGMKPSAWMRKGIPLVEEYRGCYLIKGCGCALGTAYHAKTGRTSTPAGPWELTVIASELGLPYDIAFEVSAMHFGGASREACADYLEAQGL